MAINDLRSFLQALEEKNQLLKITREVSLDQEIGRILIAIERKGMGAPFFQNVRGHSLPLVGGVLGSPMRIATALQCEPGEIPDRMGYALENPVKPEIREGAAPCQEVVVKGDEVDLGQLPVPIHAPGDAGAFFTGGVTIAKDPESGRQNLSYQRMQIKGKNRTGITINEWRHVKTFLDKAEKASKPLPVALAIGLDPAIMIAAGCRYDGDEVEIAGALRGQPIPLVPALASDLLVPALAEIIIEGEIPPGVREEEGPLGEFTGHYGIPWQSPVFLVKSISHRKNPIFQTIAGASYEHINLGNVLPREPLLKKYTTYVSKNVRNVHITPYSGGFMAVVSIKKTNPGESRNVALAAFTSHVNIKNVMVVDEDVNIYDPADLMWALSTRVIPEKDITFIPMAQGHEMDPASDERGVQTKMIIDATRDEKTREEYKKVVYEDIDLGPYLE